MGKLTKRFNVFKNIFAEVKFKEGIKFELTKKDMETYKTEVEKNLEDFISCKPEVIDNISLLHNLQETNWNLLHNLYFAAVPKREDALVEKSKRYREALDKNVSQIDSGSGRGIGNIDPNNIASIMSSPMFTQMISSVLPVVQKAFDGKDINNLNINDVVSGLMTKDPEKCGGVDIDALLKETADTLKDNFKQ